jgi:hypothetical protein
MLLSQSPDSSADPSAAVVLALDKFISTRSFFPKFSSVLF